MSDTISRQAVKLIESDPDAYPQEWNDDYEKGFTDALNKVLALPPAQPEPAISLSWINKHIEWLKSLDNSFAELTVMQISTMVKTWKDEQDD